MKPKVTAIIITALLLGASHHLIALRVSAQANAPVLTDGDFWEYETKSSYMGLMMEGTERLAMVGNGDITVGENVYSVFIFDTEGEGSYEGTSEGIYMRGDWTGEGKVYYNKTDFQLVKSVLNMELVGMWRYFVAGSMTMTVSNITNYEIISNDWKYPISVGNVGESHTKATSHVVTNLDMGSSIPENETTEDFNYYEKITYSCIGSGTNTIPAGTFETYHIEMEKEDGSYYIAWYSPEVGNNVMIEYYDVDGLKVVSDKLTAYHYESAIDDPSMRKLLYVVLIVIAGVVVIAFGLIAMNRRKKRAVKILVKKSQKQPDTRVSKVQPQESPSSEEP